MRAAAGRIDDAGRRLGIEQHELSRIAYEAVPPFDTVPHQSTVLRMFWYATQPFIPRIFATAANINDIPLKNLLDVRHLFSRYSH